MDPFSDMIYCILFCIYLSPNVIVHLLLKNEEDLKFWVTQLTWTNA